MECRPMMRLTAHRLSPQTRATSLTVHSSEEGRRRFVLAKGSDTSEFHYQADSLSWWMDKQNREFLWMTVVRFRIGNLGEKAECSNGSLGPDFYVSHFRFSRL